MALDPEAIREVTKEVLSRPEFAGPNAWQEVIAAILKELAKGLTAVTAWSAENPRLATIVSVILGLILLALLLHIVYLSLGDLLPFRRKKETRSAAAPRWDILEGKAKNWREALELARAMLAEGDLRRAIWLAHRVLLGLLDEEGAIRFEGWKTNSQYLRECAAGHPWYGAFAELTDIYEQAIYARRAAPPARAESAVLRVDELFRERAA